MLNGAQEINEKERTPVNLLADTCLQLPAYRNTFYEETTTHLAVACETFQVWEQKSFSEAKVLYFLLVLLKLLHQGRFIGIANTILYRQQDAM